MDISIAVILYCVSVGVVTAGILQSGIDIILSYVPSRPKIVKICYVIQSVLFVITGALHYYKSVVQHGTIALHDRPAHWLMAGLASVTAVCWSFLLGLIVLNCMSIAGLI